MKTLYILLFCTSLSVAQQISKTELSQYSKTFTLDTLNHQLSGDGYKLLKNEIAINQYFMLGEYHNSSLISKFTQSLFPTFTAANYKVWATEISPTSVVKLNSFLKSNDFYKKITEFNIKYGKNNNPIPFFSLSEDFEMLKSSKLNGFELWGLDQHYFGGFQFVIDDIYNGLDSKTKLLNPNLLQDSRKNGQEGDKAFVKIFDLSKDKKAQSIKNEMLHSVSIYAHYSERNYYENNTVRSKLMKSNFYDYNTSFFKKNKFEPKVFFKFGSNHVAKGLSPLGIADLGDFVNQYAQMENKKSLHVQLCYRYELVKNKMTDLLDAGEYPKELLEMYDENKWVVLDLRPFQAKLYNLQQMKDAKIELSKEMINAIKQFDLLILSPEKVN